MLEENCKYTKALKETKIYDRGIKDRRKGLNQYIYLSLEWSKWFKVLWNI